MWKLPVRAAGSTHSKMLFAALLPPGGTAGGAAGGAAGGMTGGMNAGSSGPEAVACEYPNATSTFLCHALRRHRHWQHAGVDCTLCLAKHTWLQTLPCKMGEVKLQTTQYTSSKGNCMAWGTKTAAPAFKENPPPEAKCSPNSSKLEARRADSRPCTRRLMSTEHHATKGDAQRAKTHLGNLSDCSKSTQAPPMFLKILDHP